jgi:hypothetical protein
MCCALATLALIGPRGLGVLWWLFEPTRWAITFGGSFIVPFLGLLFLPWATLAYLVVAPGGLDTFDVIFVVFAAIVDIVTFGGGYFSNGRRSQANMY